jgi:hypothetical protein
MFDLLCALGKLEGIVQRVFYVWKKIPNIVTREWAFKNIIRLHREKLLNCYVFHCFMSNFQGEKFEKMKSDGVGDLLLNSHIYD